MNRALIFCPHLARATRTGRKTTTWKPLSKDDIARRRAGYTSDVVAFPVGSLVSIMEPYGHVGHEVVHCSDFASETYGASATPPMGYAPAPGFHARASARILGCELRELHSITEDEAVATGMIPRGNRSCRDEFEAQWRDMYRGAQAWDENPLCWLVAYAEVTP